MLYWVGKATLKWGKDWSLLRMFSFDFETQIQSEEFLEFDFFFKFHYQMLPVASSTYDFTIKNFW